MMEDESSQNEDGKQLALKNLLFCEGEEHRVQHDDDSRVKLGENDGNTDSTSENAKAHGSSPSRRSPDPNCAICLGTLENKSFTDSCFHTFCFTCLVEWSKVKAECPLCKQPFKSIVHNVRSIEDYDQYYISSRNTDTSWRGTDARNFRYRSTLTSERWSGRHRYGTFEDSVEYRTHRMIYAPHSVSFPPVRNYIPEYPSTSSFRRHIYESGLWVKPLGDGNTQRYRITSPEFYRQNPACTHRLTPWLNRELLALLHDSESQVTFVLELILALIMRYDIRSEEFYVHIEPYLQHRTSHFIHEFFNYAASLHDMRSYDNCAVYEKLETISENSTNIMSSPGSDVIPITTPSITNSENSPSVIQTVTPSDLRKRKTKKSSKRQPKLFLRRNQQSNIWQSVLPTSSRSLNSTSSGDSSDYVVSSSIQGFLDLGVVSGPSTSGLQATSTQSTKTGFKSFSHVNESSGSSDTDNECVIVDIVKPRALRTPEIVNLISSSEDERMIDSNDGGDCCVTAEVENTTIVPSKRLEAGEEKVAGKKGSKKQKYHRKRPVNSILNDFSSCENLSSQTHTPASPAPHEQGISSSLSTSVCTRIYTENDDVRTSQELPLGQDSLDSQLTVSDKHTSYCSSSTECSQSAYESERTSSTNKNFSKVSFSGEDVPSSISPSSVTQTLNMQVEPVFSVVAIKQGSEFTFNCKSLSLTQNEQNKRSCEKWQHNNSNSSSSVEESATFEVSENRGKLRSVICRFSAASDKQNSRSDPSHHTSSHSKKHKHKKKKKKHKHKHHKHSHSLSD